MQSLVNLTEARGHVVLVLVAAFIIATETAHFAQPRPSPLPRALDGYLRSSVGLTAKEHNQLIAGRPVTKLLEADQTKEVAIFGAVWINAPIRSYIEAVKDIEKLERGRSFRLTKRISDPPSTEDFVAMKLTHDDFDDLRSCRVGDCAIKLGAQALERFRTEIPWKTASARDAANSLMQRLAFEYVTRYLEGGNDELAVYRDGSRPTFVAQEFRAMIGEMPELTTYMPEIKRYLLDYPKVTLPDATSFLYWQETEFGLKPTIRINHLTIREAPEDTIVVSKMLYASHYFWTGLELRVLVPDPARGTGFWFVTVSRCRSDGLSGFTGMFVRRRVRSEVQKGALAALTTTKQRLEGLRQGM
jgi:hypothetical protein